MAQTGQRRPTTTERGLGSEHQKLRRELLPLAYGTPCWRCGEPMLKGQRLELDHGWPRALAGPHNDGPRQMAHMVCNRRAGAILANKLKAQRRQYARQAAPFRSRW